MGKSPKNPEADPFGSIMVDGKMFQIRRPTATDVGNFLNQMMKNNSYSAYEGLICSLVTEQQEVKDFLTESPFNLIKFMVPLNQLMELENPGALIIYAAKDSEKPNQSH